MTIITVFEPRVLVQRIFGAVMIEAFIVCCNGELDYDSNCESNQGGQSQNPNPYKGCCYASSRLAVFIPDRWIFAIVDFLIISL